MKNIDESGMIPLGILRRVITATVIRHQYRDVWEFNLGIFFRHYKVFVTDAELMKAKNQADLVRSKWIECVSKFHEDMQFLKKRERKTENKKKEIKKMGEL